MKPNIIADLSILALVMGMIGGYAVLSHNNNRIAGKVRAVDGDTIEFVTTGQRVRLAGIDAPEARQPCLGDALRRDCGLMATVHLMNLIGAWSVVCQLEPASDQYGRRVGECWTGAVVSLNAAMVMDGYAMDYPRYSGGKYAEHNLEALANQRGLWASGGFERPWLYRERNYANAKHGDKFPPIAGQ